MHSNLYLILRRSSGIASYVLLWLNLCFCSRRRGRFVRTDNIWEPRWMFYHIVRICILSCFLVFLGLRFVVLCCNHGLVSFLLNLGFPFWLCRILVLCLCLFCDNILFWCCFFCLCVCVGFLGFFVIFAVVFFSL